MTSRNRIRKFQTIDQVQAFLNGGIQGSKLTTAQSFGREPQLGPQAQGLVGATLTFTEPSSITVTFQASSISGGSANGGNNPDPNTLLFADIKKQIEAALATVIVSMADGALLIQEVTPNHGVTIQAGSGGGFATVVGTVNLNTLSFGSGGTVDTLTLVLSWDGNANLTTTFVAPANAGAIITQINAVTAAHGITASMNGLGQLVLTSSDQGAAASIAVINTSTSLTQLGLTAATFTGAAVNTANSLLGFDESHNTVGLFYATPTTNTAPCWVWAYSTNDNMHVLYTLE